MRVMLDVKGHVRDVSIERATDPLFARSATKAVRKWHYQPVLLAGRPVAVRFCVVVAFGFR
jgi:TonB family protein